LDRAKAEALMRATAYIDGSGNSGGIEAAACILYHADAIWDRTTILPVGTTNNVGEYSGVLLAVRYAKELQVDDLEIFSDSKLIVNQLNGSWRCKEAHLRKLRDQIWEEAESFRKISIQWIPRDENQAADGLCRKAIAEARAKSPRDQRSSALSPGNNPFVKVM
jgi:probable phosphoglycerate mutase